jgi:hypothetical protein
MSASNSTFSRISSLSFVPASVRFSGAVRYRCPQSGSYVLVTDPDAMQQLFVRPLRCAGCGGLHRLTRGDEDEFVASSAA